MGRRKVDITKSSNKRCRNCTYYSEGWCLKNDVEKKSYQRCKQFIWGKTILMDLYLEKRVERKEQLPRWIPIIKRLMTDEEKMVFKDILDVNEDIHLIDNKYGKMPTDGETVYIKIEEDNIITVVEDTFHMDMIKGCYFENHNIENVIAWMPLQKAVEK